MKALFLGCAIAFASIACAGSSSGDGVASDSGAASETSSHDTSSEPDVASDAHNDAIDTGFFGDSAIGDASAIDVVDTSDGGDPIAPHPPADATKCGEGVFSAGDASTACMKPSFVLDDALLPDGGHGATPRACGALSVSGGVWQVWCGPSATYVWARFDDVHNTGALKDCHGGSLLDVDEGVYDTGSSGGNGAEVRTFQAPFGEIIGTPPGVSQTATFELTLKGKWPTGDGGASLFVLGSLDDSCLGGPQPPVVLTGVGVMWKAP